MKKLFVFPMLVWGLSSLAQSAAGIDEEQMIVHGSYQATDNDRVTVKRIALRTGVELEYAEQGNRKGVPVIFLHGVTDSWHSFETTFPHLPQTIHAFALSQRGHGDSERPIDAYTPKHFAADVAAFIEQNQLGPAVIVGHSMGGMVAQQFVLDYPRLARALVIIDSDPAFSANPGMPELYQEVMKMEGAPNKEFMVEFQKASLSKPIDSTYFDLLVNEGMKVPIPVFKAAMTGLVEVDYTQQLKKVSQPALIFWGEKDAFCKREGQERFTKNLRNATWLVYKATGHALHWEEPKRFAKDLAGFIEKVL